MPAVSAVNNQPRKIELPRAKVEVVTSSGDIATESACCDADIVTAVVRPTRNEQTDIHVTLSSNCSRYRHQQVSTQFEKENTMYPSGHTFASCFALTRAPGLPRACRRDFGDDLPRKLGLHRGDNFFRRSLLLFRMVKDCASGWWQKVYADMQHVNETGSKSLGSRQS